MAADVVVPLGPAFDAEALRGPAVSDINGKFGGAVGTFDGDTAGLVLGSLSVPLGHSFGLQGDFALGAFDAGVLGGVAAHLFWRDPVVGLGGLYGAYTHHGPLNVNVGRLGLEAEAYFDAFSLEGVVGVEFGDIPTGVFGRADLAFYPTDNFRFDVGVRYYAETFSASIGAEYLFSNGVSLFAQGRYYETGAFSAYAGLQFYFGGDDKSLIRRHREDDPRNRLPDDLFSIVGGAPGAGNGGNGNGNGGDGYGGDGYGYGAV